jgi:nucleoside-diphosphate-sugar epimerase
MAKRSHGEAFGQTASGVQPSVLVFGGRGWIGQMVCAELEKRGIAHKKAESRAEHPAAVAKELDELKPTHVMSFLGRTHGTTQDGRVIGTIDYLEEKGKLFDNVRDNLYGPLTLAMLCKARGVHFTYLGTGCIFEYDGEHPREKAYESHGFTEESQPNFFGSSYSTVKGFTDQLMNQFDSDVLNLRIRMPITGYHHTRNFITKICKYERVCSVPNSMTVLDELIPVLIDMALARESGPFNLTNPGVISHNEILEMYKEIVDPSFTWKNFTIEEQSKILASARSNNRLETNKLTAKYPVSDIKTSVRNALKKMKPL